MNKNASHEDILKVLDNSKSVLIVSHKQPDGDTVGAALALAHYVESLGKTYSLYCADIVSSDLEFLPKSKEIGPHKKVWAEAKFDTLVVVDTGDLTHAKVDDLVKQATHDFVTINIDHHITNTRYGDYNLVISDASSACEIVYHLLNNGRVITLEIANCLLTGIVTDTGSFSNLATTASAIEAASRLVSLGANITQISRHTLQYRPFSTLRLWGRALERLHQCPKTGMVVTALTLEDIHDCEADKDAVSGISNFLNSLEQASEKAILVLAQSEPNLIKGSLRTTNPLIDVSEFAKLYGGGGHKKAAGFTIPGQLTVTKNGYSITPSN